MTINNELHARALKEFGRGYLSPTRTDNMLSVIFERIDSAEARADAAEKRIAELEAINADLNDLLEQKDGLDAGRKLDRELEASKATQ